MMIKAIKLTTLVLLTVGAVVLQVKAQHKQCGGTFYFKAVNHTYLPSDLSYNIKYAYVPCGLQAWATPLGSKYCDPVNSTTAAVKSCKEWKGEFTVTVVDECPCRHKDDVVYFEDFALSLAKNHRRHKVFIK